jgi:nucleoside-diphosphate-sugar epimerase
MARALILGGTGAIGRATARRLLAAGWRVEVTGRDPARTPAEIVSAGGQFVEADRADLDRLTTLVGDGVDLLVDCLCFTAVDAAQLLGLAAHAGSTVMISSKAVYVDHAGNHSNSDVPPVFDGPIGERQPTLAPGGGDHTTREGYGTSKVAAEQVLLDSGLPVTVLRPSKIHGAGALRDPRVGVREARLDRRPALPRGRGSGVDHQRRGQHRVVDRGGRGHPGADPNVADPDAPKRLGSRTIAAHLGHE